ncbi:MAG: hypothetical protein Q7S26_00910 [bacterium]|nr:hypothetical protein [bacterium]
MGVIEQKIKRDIRRTKINTAILGTLSVAGILAVGVLAPNVLGAMGKVGIIKSHQKQGIKRSLSRLITHGYIVVEGMETGKRLRLTPKGERCAALLGEGRLMPKKTKRWDKKWRILIFDIPERRRKTRDQIRITLVTLGFRRLQDSVWVYPYDCEDIITLLKVDFRIGKDVLYIVADTIEYDLPLKKHFNLM